MDALQFSEAVEARASTNFELMNITLSRTFAIICPTPA